MELPKTGDLLLGKYRLEERIGEGGMGVVFAARHELLGQRVAVKVIRPEYAGRVETVSRFINEARAAARIDNDHVARVLDVGRLEDGLPYMVLEFLSGWDLAYALRHRGPLPIPDVADYLLQSIEAIAHAHAAGIVHRDLKPSNLFLARRSDGTARVKVLDFGISKITGTGDEPEASVTRTDTMLGSPAYMSPEQLRDAKRVDARSDIWALGVVAYELLTGHRPFRADNAVALFAAIQESKPASVRAHRRDVSHALDAIILKCLRSSPAERFASVTELALALSPFGSGAASGAYAASDRILSRPSSSPSVAASAGSSDRGEIAFADTFDSAPGTDRMQPPVSVTLEAPGSPSGDRSPAQPLRPAPFARRRSGVAFGAALAVCAALVALAAARSARVRMTAVAPAATGVSSMTAPASNGGAASVPPQTSLASAASIPTEAESAPTGKSPSLGKLRAPAQSAKASPPPPSAYPASCNPPYDFDKDGKKIWRRECL